jgi:hypothetical protein
VVAVDAVFGHSEFVWMLETDVALVCLDPGLEGTAGLPDVDLPTLTGYTVHTRSLESQVILHRLKETGHYNPEDTHLRRDINFGVLYNIKVRTVA